MLILTALFNYNIKIVFEFINYKLLTNINNCFSNNLFKIYFNF